MTAIGLEQPEQYPDGRGLARAVGADEPVDLAPGNLQVNTVEGGETAEPLDESLRQERVFHQSISPFSSVSGCVGAS